MYVLYFGEYHVLNIPNEESHINLLIKFYVSFTFFVCLFVSFRKRNTELPILIEVSSVLFV